MINVKKYSKKNTWQIMNHTGFGKVRMYLANGIYAEIGKKGLLKSGQIKQAVKKLLNELTIENVLLLSKRYDVEVYIVAVENRMALVA